VPSRGKSDAPRGPIAAYRGIPYLFCPPRSKCIQSRPATTGGGVRAAALQRGRSRKSVIYLSDNLFSSRRVCLKEALGNLSEVGKGTSTGSRERLPAPI